MALDCGSYGLTVGGGRLLVLKPAGQKPDALSLAIGLEIDPGDESITDKHGQAVVAVQPLLHRFVDLQHLVEAEEGRNPLAVPQHRIEGREQNAPVLPRPKAIQSSGEIQVFRPDPPGCATALVVHELASYDLTSRLELAESGSDEPGSAL